MKLKILIPSMGRAEAGKQVTLRQLVKAGVHTTLVVPPQEFKAYWKRFQRFADVVECNETGIGATRAWIFRKWSDKRILMLDDDMYFYRRVSMDKPTLVRLGDKGIHVMLARIEELLKKYLMVGISARQGNNHVDEEFVTNARSMNAYAFDVPKIFEVGIKFGRVPVMEDFDITLQLLRNGYSNAVLYRYCWNQVGSNEVGGCSSYRTAEMQAAAAHRLKELHPDFVTVVQKKTKATWQGMQTRTDVRIAWQKAAQEGQA